jgi:hypothetical protein
VIRARPGTKPSYYVIGRSGALLPVKAKARLPASVLQHGAWLSALADKRPLPAGVIPQAVIAPSHGEDAFVAFVP